MGEFFLTSIRKYSGSISSLWKSKNIESSWDFNSSRDDVQIRIEHGSLFRLEYIWKGLKVELKSPGLRFQGKTVPEVRRIVKDSVWFE